MKNKSKVKKGLGELIADEAIGFLAFPFFALFWAFKALGTFLYGVPPRRMHLYGMVRFIAVTFVFYVLTPEQPGVDWIHGDLISSSIKGALGENAGGVVFMGIQVALFIALMISFMVMAGMNTNADGAHYDYRYAESEPEGGLGNPYPRISRMLQNLEGQFTYGSRASDLMAYLRKHLFVGK